MSEEVKNLFENAHDEGLLSAASIQALQVVDIGQQIQNGLGVSVDDVEASEVVLVTMMPDDSGSIRFSGNSQLVRDGHNIVLDALIKTKQKDNILAHCRYLNGTILYPFCPISDAVKMTNSNYDPNLGTPLYDQTLVVLGTVLAKSQEFRDNGVPARTITLLITDGADEHSTKGNSKKVNAVVTDMLKMENHIIAAMGIGDNDIFFKEIFQEMGIPDEWILTPGSSEKEIRKAFSVFSQSASQASQSAANFSKAALGGFGTN